VSEPLIPGDPVDVIEGAREPTEPWLERDDLRLAAVTIAALAVVGALAGLLWSAWSRTATRGLVYTKTAIIPDQTEGFISTDGRFVVITAAIGIIAGLIAWRLRTRRGPVTVAGLAVGAVVGAGLTDLIGHLVGGGTTKGTVGTVLARLPLQVHATGALFVEAALAVAVYMLWAAFVRPDDLGRGSVRTELEVEQPGRDRHTAGPAEQDGLAPQ
jgi:Protein of unknown function (DUF2567)